MNERLRRAAERKTKPVPQRPYPHGEHCGRERRHGPHPWDLIFTGEAHRMYCRGIYEEVAE